MDKIINVNFEEWQDKQYDESLKQWDQGQQLEISGLNISDEIVEVHFSLQEYGGSAKRMLGKVIDGVIHVDIPAFILEGPEYCYENMRNYGAWAWVYLSDEESAETIRKIEFIIETRPKPEEYITPEELSFLQQLEEAIKNKITTPSSAKVGQMLVVKAVDENGKPTEWEVTDVTSSGSLVTSESITLADIDTSQKYKLQVVNGKLVMNEVGESVVTSNSITLTDTVTSKQYMLYVEKGKLTMEGVDS